MKEGPPGLATWFRFYGQRYLMGGSLRAETLPDERAVWLDFLCLANAGAGRFDCANRDSLGAQLLISRELLDRASKKFVEARRLKTFYDKRERKEVFIIVKWAYYQAPARSHKKSEKDEGEPSSPLPPSPSSSERKIDREIEREKEGGSISEASFSEKGSNSAAYLSPPPDIPENLSVNIPAASRGALRAQLQRKLRRPLL